MSFVAESRTSKEIAWELQISESAVNQRIESVRVRTGNPPRAELARLYRQYQAACNPVTAQNLQVPEAFGLGDYRRRDDQLDELALADTLTVNVSAPWQSAEFAKIVPEALDGKHAGLNRTAAMIAIAGGLLLVAMVGLSVIQTLSGLL